MPSSFLYVMRCGRYCQRYKITLISSYVRAFEVGYDPISPKYECAIKLRALRDAPIIRGQIKLPHSVKTDVKVCVICPPDSKQAQQARDAGAFMVGEDEVFALVKSGKIPFDRCIAVPASVPNIGKAGIARILGPRGLMPSNKLGTVTENVANSVKLMLGGNVYKENNGVVRMAVGRLNYSPEQLRDNVRAFLEKLKLDAAGLSETSPKSVLEVVLSSTHSPGFSLDGNFRSEDSPPTEMLSG